MGLFKKVKKGVNKAAKSTSSGLSAAGSGIAAAANELERQGVKVNQEIGRIEGYVGQGYDVTAGSVVKAVEEVGGFIEDLGAFLARFGLEIYLKAIRPLVKDCEDMAGAITGLGPQVLGQILALSEDLILGRYNSAVTIAQALMRPGEPLHKFAQANKHFPGTSLLISVDLAANGPSTTSAAGSVGLAIQLDPSKEVQMTVFVGMGASVSLDASGEVGSASITIGFAKGGPKSVAGPGIAVTVGPFGFGFGCALAPPTFLPPFSSFTVSIPFEDFVTLAATGTFKVNMNEASLGGAFGMVLQTVRQPSVASGNLLSSSYLDGSQWTSSEGDTLVLRHYRRRKKKNRDYYEVLRNGTLMSRDEYTLRKRDGYDGDDKNLLVYNGVTKTTLATGRIGRDGNEFWLQGTGRVTWFRDDE